MGLLCLIGFGAMAQEMPSVVPPAPEAASLGKYTDMPVNYSSGLPQISIPMFTASSRDISVPVSLSYHAGGIRVEEIASRVGLGWNLQAGGNITRTVRGIADDGPNGWLDPSETVADFEAAADTGIARGSKYQLMQEALGGNNDYEPDVFNFSYPGGGGKFFFDDNGDVITIPASEHKIDYVMGGGNLAGITSFTVTNTSGYKYFYGQYGNEVARDSTGTTQSYTDDGSTSGIVVPSDQARNQYSSWYLLAIQSPVSDATVTFTYGSQNTTSLNRGSQTKMYEQTAQEMCPTPITLRTSYIKSENRETVLNTITFENGTINFLYESADRTDLQGGKALDKVTLKDNDGTVLKTFDLVQDYWTSTDHGSITPPLTGINQTHLTKRMYLQKVVETGENSADPKEYTFDYNDASHMPNRFSFDQDIWGFYNGNHGNPHLIPHHYDRGTSPTPVGDVIDIVYGADRRSDTESSKIYSLKSMTYPTGGTANFEYESNGVYRISSDAYYTNTFFETVEDTLADYTYSSGTNYTEIQFTVDDTHLDGTLLFNYDVTGCSSGEEGPGGIVACGLTVTLQGVTDTGYLRELSLRDGAMFNVAEGTYKLQLQVEDPTNVTAATAMLRAFNNASPYAERDEFEVGGLRLLRTIIDDKLDHKLIKEYSYVTNETATTAAGFGTSGVLATQKWDFYEPGISYCSEPLALATQHSAQSLIPAAGTGAGHVTYTKVVEAQLPDNGLTLGSKSTTGFHHGFTVHEYDFAYDEAQSGTEVFPFAPYKQVDWMRGNLEKQSQYKKEGSSLEQVQLDSIKLEYTTQLTDPFYHEVKAVKIDQRGSISTYSYYNVYAGANHIVKRYTKTTQDNGVVEQSTDYEYNNHYLRPDKTITNHSDGQKTIVKTQYTDDTFGNELTLAERNVLSSMVTANILGPVLTETFAENESTPIAKSLTAFGDLTPGFLPVSTRIWNRDTGGYEERLTFSYTTNGNYEHLVKDGHQQMAYIWNYGNTRPTAQVTNVSDVDDIAYSSFESTGKGHWTYTGATTAGSNLPSGSRYYNVANGSVSKTGLASSKSYVVSFWAKNGTPAVSNSTDSGKGAITNANGWTYHEKIVSGASSVTISGTGHIDELRLYPVNAQMSTYTYDPLRGVTSMGSPNNLFTHYEYDEHGRLSVVRDQDGNILKVNQYAYKADVNELQN